MEKGRYKTYRRLHIVVDVEETEDDELGDILRDIGQELAWCTRRVDIVEVHDDGIIKYLDN